MFSYRVGTEPETGKELKTTRRGFKTKKEAMNAYKALIVDVEVNGYKAQKMDTVEDLYHIWLPIYQNTVRSSTFKKTKGIFEYHIIPTLGRYRVEKLTVMHCQEAVNKWYEDLKRYDKVVPYAKKLLKYATSIDLISKNPMESVTMPKRKEYNEDAEIENFYSKEELKEFLISLKSMRLTNKKQKITFFRLLSATGLRRGEIVALKWSDIDMLTGMITIDKNLTYDNNGLVMNPPKTKESKRKIMIDQSTLGVLKDWKKTQTKELARLGLRKKENQPIFQNGSNNYHQPTAPRKWLESILKKNGMPFITLHGFRHTHCSILFEAGLNVKQVQKRLGHSDIKTTLDIYTHLTQKSKNEVASIYGDIMKFD